MGNLHEAKICSTKHLTECVTYGGVSTTWRRMLDVKEAAENNIRWVIGLGNVKFWLDKWCAKVRLIELVTPAHLKELSVQEAMQSTKCLDFCMLHLQQFLMEDIRKIAQRMNNVEDECV